ncbi:hypothetical protein A3A84_01105 [Candidatus Collierbacteria bacterium RIFCSPLOWO2_01_FULL_50_23]|uniref:Transglycosylase SLT domain-containing protein n=2 Tax=Candidatus Collieribacteriota TaxID=1752725 RepID=A0A1F5EST9_9BACT|nr:MAG: hypothetical protein A3D09_00720 [Candidatus Collierbacteria bacterium RIFCSPHIGHO2_02_FULL_49_10]OGD72418.1 MAG: hypothetical protein A2703_00360 [Candidatus Collierbacteria bacterium RIFCSPHIGHO2_01_FULL_50_25]OGD74258.1 MAG: hypothetical protein A3A84_01105 [Candidatus Collierbacteria bacterium RIFCSPLOWO2_01_FULL_50_23]
MVGERRFIRKLLFTTGMALTAVTVVGSFLNSHDNSQATAFEPHLSGTGPRSAEATAMPCEISSKYPEQIQQWRTLVAGYACLRGFDPNLVAALVWQESGGDPDIISHSGAVGLMQVMPSDGVAATFLNDKGEPYFANRPTMAELKNPTFNVDYGTGILEGLRNKISENYKAEQLADQAIQRTVLREALKKYGPRDRGYEYADIVLAIYDQNR